MDFKSTPASAVAITNADGKKPGYFSTLSAATGGPTMAAPSASVRATLAAAAQSILDVKLDTDKHPIPKTLLEFAVRVLNTHDTLEKCAWTLLAQQLWYEQKLPLGCPVYGADSTVSASSATSLTDMNTILKALGVPDKPARPLNLKSVPPSQMPKYVDLCYEETVIIIASDLFSC
jgi:hypothetical protein